MNIYLKMSMMCIFNLSAVFALITLIVSTNGNSVPKRIRMLNNALGISKNSEALWDILDIPVNTGDIADLEMRVDGLESFKSKSLVSTNGNSVPKRIRKLNKALGIPKNSEALWDILDIPVNTGDIADLEM